MRKQTDSGFSLIELLIVVAIIGIIAAIAVPMLMDAMDRARQRRTMGDMHSIVTANGTYNVDMQSYSPNLPALQAGGYLEAPVTTDAWGTNLVYVSPGPTYSLTSLGSDGAAGPAAPSPWVNDPFDPDIIVANGAFTQAPEG